jgi:anti-sigma factor ChrR (cupin superfamily)
VKHSVTNDQLIEQLALYALGALSQHEARSVEQHLAEGCELCESELKPFVSVVDSLGSATPLTNPPAQLREKLITALTKTKQPSSAMNDGLIYSLRADEGEWCESSPGVFEKQLFVDPAKQTVTTLIKMMPNTQCPSHRHLGIEECLVLKGDFRVNDEVLNAGDYRCAMPDSIDESPYSLAGNLLLIVSQGGYEAVD